MSTIKSKDGTELFLHHWPKAQPRASVVIVHGYGEHAGRYAELAGALNDAGFSVLSADNRGHGKSQGRRGYVERFPEYLDDLDVVLAEADRLTPGVPRLLIGHSMGGLIALLHAIDRQARHAGVVLSSPFLRVKLAVPAWKVLAAKAASRLYPALALPSGLSGSNVARDPDIARLYDTDPLNLTAATARWYTESLLAQDRVFNEASTFVLPVLVMHGEADAVADPVRTAEVFPRLGSTDKTLELLTGAYHEIFNEAPADRKRIVSRTIEWLNAHVFAGATGAH